MILSGGLSRRTAVLGRWACRGRMGEGGCTRRLMIHCLADREEGMEMMGLVASCRLVPGMILLDLEDSPGLVVADLDVAVVDLGDLEGLVEVILSKYWKSAWVKKAKKCMIMTTTNMLLGMVGWGRNIGCANSKICCSLLVWVSVKSFIIYLDALLSSSYASHLTDAFYIVNFLTVSTHFKPSL